MSTFKNTSFGDWEIDQTGNPTTLSGRDSLSQTVKDFLVRNDKVGLDALIGTNDYGDASSIRRLFVQRVQTVFNQLKTDQAKLGYQLDRTEKFDRLQTVQISPATGPAYSSVDMVVPAVKGASTNALSKVAYQYKVGVLSEAGVPSDSTGFISR